MDRNYTKIKAWQLSDELALLDIKLRFGKEKQE
jgi:hypothetical protein